MFKQALHSLTTTATATRTSLATPFSTLFAHRSMPSAAMTTRKLCAFIPFSAIAAESVTVTAMAAFHKFSKHKNSSL
jgi:hypothetical protein